MHTPIKHIDTLIIPNEMLIAVSDETLKRW
jgi:hypothetical protein